MISMLAARCAPLDYFVGRMALWGRFGTLWPAGVKPQGIGITLGEPGSGKSTGTAITAVLRHRGASLTLDTKGEIAQACYAACGAGGNGVQGQGKASWIFDPLGITGLPQASYNAFHEIGLITDATDALRLAFKLAEGLIRVPDGGGGDNSWVYSGAVQWVYGLIAFIMAAYPPEKRTLVTLRRLAQEGEVAHAEAAKKKGLKGVTPFDALLARMKADTAGRFRQVSASQAANIEKMGDRQQGTILTAVVEATSWLDLPKYQEAVSKCDFLLSDFRTERIAVFVCLPLNELGGMAGGLMRVFVTLFTQIMYDNVRRTPLAHGPVLCTIDEYPQYGAIPATLRLAATGRDYHVKLLVLLQDINQLRKTYGDEDASTLVGCAAYVQLMATTHDETIEWLVRSLGERLVRQRQPDGRMVTRAFPLLDLEQAKRYLSPESGNQIVLRPHARPLRLKVAPYWWFLPFWMYTPDPRHPEPRLRAWMRQRAARRTLPSAMGKGSKRNG